MKQFFLLIFFFISCNNRKNITIAIENNCNASEQLVFYVYRGKVLIKSLLVPHSKTSISYVSTSIEIEPPYDNIALTFKIKERTDSTNLNISGKELTKSKIIHVNFVEQILKKGAKSGNSILAKDSIVYKDFYSELMDSKDFRIK